jgi:hypothetical protein
MHAGVAPRSAVRGTVMDSTGHAGEPARATERGARAGNTLSLSCLKHARLPARMHRVRTHSHVLPGRSAACCTHVPVAAQRRSLRWNGCSNTRRCTPAVCARSSSCALCWRFPRVPLRSDSRRQRPSWSSSWWRYLARRAAVRRASEHMHALRTDSFGRLFRRIGPLRVCARAKAKARV